LNDLPEKFRKDEIFEKLFEIAQIARMTKNEVNNYLKDLNNMNIVRNEIRTRDNIIKNHVNTIAKKDSTIAEQCNIIAEYERRYGVLNDKQGKL